MKKPLFGAICLMLVPFIAQAAEKSAPDTTTAVDRSTPDNTKINKRDRNEQTLTPLDQSNKKADIRVTQAIRKSILRHHLSVDAKNIKIITINGEVTLRGPVNNSTEKAKIAQLATVVPGVKSLNDELEVK